MKNRMLVPVVLGATVSLLGACGSGSEKPSGSDAAAKSSADASKTSAAIESQMAKNGGDGATGPTGEATGSSDSSSSTSSSSETPSALETPDFMKSLNLPKQVGELKWVQDTAGSPVRVTDTSVITYTAGDTDFTLTSFSLEDGKQQWTKVITPPSSLHLAEGWQVELPSLSDGLLVRWSGQPQGNGLDENGDPGVWYQSVDLKNGDLKDPIKGDATAESMVGTVGFVMIAEDKALDGAGKTFTMTLDSTSGSKVDPGFSSVGLRSVNHELVLGSFGNSYRLAKTDGSGGVGNKVECQGAGVTGLDASPNFRFFTTGSLLIDAKEKKLTCLDSLASKGSVDINRVDNNGNVFGKASSGKSFYLPYGSTTPQVADTERDLDLPGAAANKYIYFDENTIAALDPAGKK